MKFENRNLNEFKQKIKDVFNLLTIEGKYKIIGSSALKNILYNSDYDLSEMNDFKNVSSGINKIIQRFKDIFKKVSQDKNLFITDFKCGIDSNDEPLRWNEADIRKGYKFLKDGHEQPFENALMDKDNTIKIDIVALIDGSFIDFSENLYFKFGQGKDTVSNYNEEDITKEKVLQSIADDYYEQLKEGKALKALKRKFAYYKLLGNEKESLLLELLINYFNGDIGIINKAHADLDTLILLIDTNLLKVKIEDIKNNLQNIKQNLSYNLIYSSHAKEIDKICKLKNKQSIKQKLELLNNKLIKFINKESLKFMKDNKFKKNKL